VEPTRGVFLNGTALRLHPYEGECQEIATWLGARSSHQVDSLITKGLQLWCRLPWKAVDESAFAPIISCKENYHFEVSRPPRAGMLRMRARPFEEIVVYSPNFRQTRISGFRARLVSLGSTAALFFLASTASCQRVQARLFDQRDGLGNPSITALAQDGAGYLWVGSQNGLFRYDGSYFREFGRADGFRTPNISNLLVDTSGTLWAGSREGLYHWDGEVFHELLYQGASLHVGMNSMLASSSSGEVILMSNAGPLSITFDIASRQWTAKPYGKLHPGFPSVDDPNGMALDAEQHLWFGSGSGICMYGPTGIRTFGAAQGVPSDFYVSMFRAGNGQMWARGRKHVVTWRPGDPKVRDLTSAFPADINTVSRRFAEDSFGNILSPTASGFATWNGSQWSETKTTTLGPIDGATALLTDREGAVWIGTPTSGLLQTLGYRQWENYGAEEGLHAPAIFGIVRDSSGQLWFGDNLGANTLRPGSGPHPEDPTQAGAGATQSLAADHEGGMWIASTLGSIVHMNAHHAVDIRISQDTYNYRIRVDSVGTLWIGTASGLFTATCVPRRHCIPRAVLPGPIAIKVDDFIFDPDVAGSVNHVPGIWIVGNHGLDHLVDGSLTHVEVPDVPNRFDLISPAPDGSLWLAGIAPGVIRVRIVGGKAAIAERRARPTLTSDYIEFIDTDHLGRLWAGTDHGVNVVSQGKIYSITDEDGLIWNDMDGKSFFEDSDGSIWIGTGKGLSHLLDPAAALVRRPFAARIEPLRYDEVTISGQSTRWKGGTVTLRFSATTFRGNRSLLYHYWLEGFDSHEIVTRTPFVRFQKLPPGSYTLHVVVEDPARHVRSSPASYQFTLTAPWWRTLWFYFLLGMFGLGLVVLGWRRSHRALLHQRQKLQRVVDERTQELRELATHDGLTHLLNRSAILSALAAECEQARERSAGVCIALIDLDHFKEVNDTFGHLAGDEVLRQTAARLAGAVRNTDALGRYGGEEFLIIFRDAPQECGLERCEDIRQSLLSEAIVFEQHKLKITCSIGLAWSRAEDDAVTNLLARADHAMYQAKAKGRNRVESGLAVRV